MKNMYDTIESIKNRIKNKRTRVATEGNIKKSDKEHKNDRIKYCKNLLSRVLLAIIFVLGSIIFTRYSADNLLMYRRYILNDTWSFAKINAFYKEHFGGILPFDNIITSNTRPVFNETLIYRSIEAHLNGVSLEVGNSYLVPAITSGIIVFIGEKEGYGNTIIIQGIDGFDIWYGGVRHKNLRLYDYIERGSLIGESINSNIYIVIQKNGEFISYEEYNR